MAIPKYEISLVLVSISSLCSANCASFAPIHICKNSFGVTHAVASMNVCQDIVGIVLSAPLLMLKGNGHRRIMQRNLSPSCLRTSAKAVNRASDATILSTYVLKSEREVRNEQVAPQVEAVATMNHL